MNILKEGSLTKETTCKRCKTHMEYEPEDVKHVSYEDSGIKYFVECPFCKTKPGVNFCIVYVDPPGKVDD